MKKMPKRATLGKISSFLSGLKRKNANHSPSRYARVKSNSEPNSTKIGRGKITTARRNLPEDTIHRRDYRSLKMVGVTFGSRFSEI